MTTYALFTRNHVRYFTDLAEAGRAYRTACRAANEDFRKSHKSGDARCIARVYFVQLLRVERHPTGFYA